MTELRDRLQTTLGDAYRITRELGGGGMSRVFVAEEPELGRSVVVKVLPPDLGAGLNVDRFRREIQLAAQLQHPHIVPLLSAGARDGLLFYTMPLISGESVRAKLLRSGELPVNETVRILRDVADALEYAHEQGIVHRDIKPENVLISRHHALVTDFGVSKALSSATGEQQLTSIGVALGTPAYMSPEQAAADPAADHRTDLYALGILGYELLSGHPPFSGGAPQQVLAAQITQQPVPITKHRPSIPPALAQLIMRSLEKKPADRFQSAGELRALLESLAMTPSGGSQPVSAAYSEASLRPPWLRRELVIGGVAAALLLTALLASRYLGGGSREGPAFVVAGARQITSDAGIEITPALSPDGKLLAYSGGTPSQTFVFVRQVEGGEPVRIGPGRGPRWSPDGSRLVFVNDRGIVSAPALGGTPRLLIPHSDSGRVIDPVLSHDGRWLAYVHGRTIRVADVDGNSPRVIADAVLPHSLAWSPDDNLLAYVADNAQFVWATDRFANISPSTIWIVARSGGAATQITGETQLNLSPSWLPAGDGVLYVSNAGGGRDIYLQPIDGRGHRVGEPQRLTTGLSVHGISLSADGRFLAYSNLSSAASIWSVAVPSSGEVSVADARQLTSASERIEMVSVSPDGQWLAFDSDRAGNADIYKMRVDGSGREQLTSDPADEFRPTWSPDASEVSFHSWAAGNRDSYIMRADGSGRRLLLGGPRHEWSGRWSPDGRQLALHSDRHGGAPSVYVVSSDGSGLRRLISGGGYGPTWSPDGRWIAYSRGGLGPTEAVVIPAAGGQQRVLTMPGPPGRYFSTETCCWTADSRAIWVRLNSRDPADRFHIARVPIDGSPGSIVVRFDRPDRQPLQPEFSSDGRNFYFALGRHEADIWVVELQRRE